MKDQTGEKTGDLLRSAVSRRQDAFRARQLAIGRRQRPLWLTDAELAAVRALLAQIRGEPLKQR